MQFTAKMSTDPAFSCDVVPKFYLNASLALWYVGAAKFDCCKYTGKVGFIMFAELHIAGIARFCIFRFLVRTPYLSMGQVFLKKHD